MIGKSLAPSTVDWRGQTIACCVRICERAARIGAQLPTLRDGICLFSTDLRPKGLYLTLLKIPAMA